MPVNLCAIKEASLSRHLSESECLRFALICLARFGMLMRVQMNLTHERVSDSVSMDCRHVVCHLVCLSHLECGHVSPKIA